MRTLRILFDSAVPVLGLGLMVSAILILRSIHRDYVPDLGNLKQTVRVKS